MGAAASTLTSSGYGGTTGAVLVAVMTLIRLKSITRWAWVHVLAASTALRILIFEAINSIRKNPMMESMVATGVVSYIVYSVRQILQQALRNIESMFWCSIAIQNTDANYNAVVDFVAKYCEQDKSSLIATTKKLKWNRRQWRDSWNGIGEKKAPELDMRPTRNVLTTFRYKGRRIYLVRSKGQTITTGYDRRPLTMETIVLSCWGRDNKILRDLLKDAMLEKIEQSSGELNIFVLSNGWMGGWERAMSKPPREKSTVVLDSSISDELLHDARTFLTSRKWYSDRGIPYRRGYLLYGPPGCGKTSFVQVVAGELKQDMCMLSLSDQSLDDSRLAANLREAPLNSIILLEDVDAVFVSREVQKNSKATVTFSGLLNAIDGVASQEGRMLFMTTNHIEKLDPALIRPGRCDVRVELKKASSMQMKQLFLRFFPEDYKHAEQFAMKLPKFELSMAQLQGHLLENRSNPRLVIDRIPKLLQSTKPQPTDRMTVYDHLRRVGLEHYAAYFEYHGYNYRDELTGLNVNTVKKWALQLQYDPLTVKMLGQLLSADAEFYKKQYELAELSTIREAFIAAYPVEYMVTHGEAPPKLRRLSSHERHGLVVADGDSELNGSRPRRRSSTSVQEERKMVESKHGGGAGGLKSYDGMVAREIEELSKKLCERLSKNGKGMVSVYQLHYLFSIFYDPQELVENAHILTKPREEESKQMKPMTSFEWLKRAGLVKFATAAEDNDVKLAADIVKLNQGNLQEFGIRGPALKQIQTLIANKPEDANIVAGMQCLDRRRVVNRFLQAFPGNFHTAFDFAMSITDEMGRGLASRIQINAHLKKYADDMQAALDNARKDLVEVKRIVVAPVPPPKIPNFWVTQWLNSLGLKHLSMHFIGQSLSHYEDVVVEPILEVEELKKMGVRKVGDQRKIRREIKRLLDGGDDGLKHVYRGSKEAKSMFKAASVVTALLDSNKAKL
mmetsp:Transcript_22674/g.37922  ORF Transcript_22674/g.37922 Transcript_22674/m.37922 type:complete len:959 (+) Transcript_22674:1747-4623(+)